MKLTTNQLQYGPRMTGEAQLDARAGRRESEMPTFNADATWSDSLGRSGRLRLRIWLVVEPPIPFKH